MRHFLLLFLFSLFAVAVPAQNQKAIDSLENVLKTASDTNRVNVLIALSDLVHLTEPELALKYSGEAILLAEQLKFTSGLFHANMSKGLAFYGIGSLDSALTYFEDAKVYAEQRKDLAQLASVCVNMGNAYGDKGQNKKCIQYYLLGSSYTEKLNKPEKAAYILVNIGTVYSVLGQHDSALVFYRDAEKTLSGINKDHPKLTVVYNNIGTTYLEFKDTAKAEDAFTKALRISTLENNQRGIAAASDHLAVILYYKGWSDSAYAMLNNAILIYEATGAKSGISEARVHLGELYYEDKKYAEAIASLDAGREIAEEIGDYYNLKMYYLTLSKIYEATGNIPLALDFQKKLMTVKDTLFNLSNSTVVSEMKMQLENEKSLREIDALNAHGQRQTVILYSAIAVGILILLLGLVAFNRYLVKKRASEKLTAQNEKIQLQKDIIEEKNKDITDSIRYAQRIQNAILPSKEAIRKIFPHSFVLFRPKDIVSGDFYWFDESGEYKFFSVVDCTGHGVPGAMLSVVGHNFLNKAVHDEELIMPDKLLHYLNENISKMLRQKHDNQVIQDGMDIAMCVYHELSGTLYYSGSFNSLYHIRNGKLSEIKSDKIFIGNFYEEPTKNFTLHAINVEKGDLFYVFSDGFADQFGGPTGKKFKYKPFQELLLTIHGEEMEMQEQHLSAAFETWKKTLDQVDDICIIGIKI
ncbi:MAG: tetratricopeptide repeat protein [Bacteroidota bacterium]|nr:tetratricopeptide repeat protein [Bacteroidota bacterium]